MAGSNKEKLDRALARLRSVRVNTEKITEEMVGLGVTAGSAYLASYLSAKMGGAAGYKVKGVPVELLAAGALIGLSMTGAAGKASHHLMGAGAGALFSYAAKMGYSAGIAAPQALPAGAAVHGLDELEAENDGNFG